MPASTIIHFIKTHITVFFEAVIVVSLAIGLIMFLLMSVPVLITLDWTQAAAFDELISRALLALIAIEAIQIVRTHQLRDVFFICVFVAARKAVEPTNTALEILLLSGALIVLVGGWVVLNKYCHASVREPV